MPKQEAKQVKVYIKSKNHLLSEWDYAAQKGFTLEDKTTDLPYFIPASIVFHLAERMITVVRHDPYVTAYGTFPTFEEAKEISSLKDVKIPRRRDPKKAYIAVTRKFATLQEAEQFVKEVNKSTPNTNKIYQALKYKTRYLKFTYRWYPGKYTLPEAPETGQLQLPFVLSQ